MDAKRRYVYAILDDLAEDFGPLFEAPTDAVALRNFNALIRGVDDVSRNDYVLYRFGEFSIIEGGAVLVALAEPVEVKVEVING